MNGRLGIRPVSNNDEYETIEENGARCLEVYGVNRSTYAWDPCPAFSGYKMDRSKRRANERRGLV